MDLGLKDKVVLVSGASRGIGRAIAEAFAAEGARLALCARSGNLLNALTAELEDRHGAEALAVPADLGTPEGVTACTDRVMQHFGGVDVLVNNAGAIRAGGLLDKPDAEWLEDWQLKLFGYVRLSRALFPSLEARGGGRIVNIIGNGGRQPSAGYLAGAGANAALMAITKGLAEQGGAVNVLVNAINPGPVRTERWADLVAGIARQRGVEPRQVEQAMFASIPIKRPAEPEEVAAVAVFLASAQASYINGEIVQVDGGAANCL